MIPAICFFLTGSAMAWVLAMYTSSTIGKPKSAKRKE